MKKQFLLSISALFLFSFHLVGCSGDPAQDSNSHSSVTQPKNSQGPTLVSKPGPAPKSIQDSEPDSPDSGDEANNDSTPQTILPVTALSGTTPPQPNFSTPQNQPFLAPSTPLGAASNTKEEDGIETSSSTSTTPDSLSPGLSKRDFDVWERYDLEKKFAELTLQEVSELSQSDMAKYPTSVYSGIAAERLGLLSLDIVSAFDEQILRDLNTNAIQGFTSRQIKVLSPDQVARIYQKSGAKFTGKQIQEMTPEQIEKVDVLRLTDSDLADLPPHTVAMFNPRQFRNLDFGKKSNLVEKFSDETLVLLSAEQIDPIAKYLTQAQVAALTETQLQGSAIEDLGKDRLDAISPEVFAKLPSAILKRIDKKNRPFLTSLQLATLSTEQIVSGLGSMTFSDEQVKGLTPDHIKGLTHVGYFMRPEEIAVMSQMQALAWLEGTSVFAPAKQVAAIPVAYIPSVSEEDFGLISSEGLTALTQDQADQVTLLQIKAIEKYGRTLKSIKALDCPLAQRIRSFGL